MTQILAPGSAEFVNYGGLKLHRLRQLEELDRTDCEDSLHHFLRKAWRFIDPAPFVDGWVIDALCDHLEAVVDGDIKRLLINIPPRMGKSSIISVAFPVWIWTQSSISPITGPQVPILHCSYAHTLARRDSIKRRRLLKTNWYQRLYGNRFQISPDQDTKERFSNTAGGEMIITSVDSGITGEGGNCFVAGTMVSTPSGRRPIEQLRWGDAVIAFDHLQGKVVTSRIIASTSRAIHELCRVDTFSGRSVLCTPDHPVYSPGRGYIAAARLGYGDWLLDEEGSPDRVISSVRQLREAGDQAAVRGAQGSPARQPGCLLLQDLQSIPPQREAPSQMRSLRRTVARTAYTLLLRGMRAKSAVDAAAQKTMSVLQDIVYGADRLLFTQLCEPRAFLAHAGIGKQQVQKFPDLFEPVSGNGRDHTNPGRTSLCGVPAIGQTDQTSERSNAFGSACASYRREYATQPTGKPSDAMHVVSQETSSRNAIGLSDIAIDSTQSHRVYDIQVEGCSNFFAEGILVHNCIIVDDPNNAREILSDSVATATNEDWWDGAMPTRLNDQENGAIIVVQQRLGEQDLSGHILENDKASNWEHLVLPMHFEEGRRAVTSIGWADPRQTEGELLWPERFSEKSVQEVAVRLGKWRAAGQLEQRPEPKGGGIIQRNWWQVWPPNGEEVDPATGKPKTALEFPPMSYILGSLDTAFTENTMNDPSAMTVWGVFSQHSDVNIPTRVIRRDGQSSIISVYGSEAEIAELTRPKMLPKVMLMYAWSGYYELHKLLKRVDDTCRSFQVDCLMIENKSRGHDVGVELRRTLQDGKYSIYMNEVPGGLDKVARLYSVQHIFEEKMVYAPERPWAEAVMTQCGTFPNAKHDDLVDTCIHSANILMADGTTRNIRDVRAGQLVQTPIGPRRVLEAARTGIKPVYRLEWSGGGQMEATGNHPIWVNGTWKRLDEIQPCDTLSSWHGKLNPALLSSPSTSTDINTIGTPRLGKPIIDATSVVAAVRRFIERSGNAIAEKFPTAGMFTTRTAIPSTTGCAISPASLLNNTVESIWPNTSHADDHLSNAPIWRRSMQRLQHGIDHLKGRLGTDVTTVISVREPVPGVTKGVYNLRVEEAECYYANGILVHNCSQALRRLRAMGMLNRPPELQVAATESIKYQNTRSVAPLYPGSRAR